MNQKKTIQTIGKRKCAIARATLSPGNGKITINHKVINNLASELSQARILEPILLAGDTIKEVNISVNVSGGGCQGKTEASRLAIARALANYNKKLKKTFLDYDRQLMIADIRMKEQRKPNDSRARAKREKSYR